MARDSKILRRFSLLFVCIILAGLLATLALATVSQVPLFLTTGTKPNLFFVLDNSGSMWNICWHPDYPAAAGVNSGYAWFNGFSQGAADNLVLKYDDTIKRNVLYFKSNNWGTGTGSNTASDFADLSSTTPLPTTGMSYVRNSNANTSNYDKVIIADPNGVFWITPYDFTANSATTTTTNPIYWDSSAKNYLIINSANAKSSQATTVKGYSLYQTVVGVNLPHSSDSQNSYNTWYAGSYLNWLYFAASSTALSQVDATSTYDQYHQTRIHTAKAAVIATINNTLNPDGSSKYRWAGYTYTTSTNSAPPRLGPTTWTDPDSAANITSLKSAIDGVWPGGGTPLGNTIQMLWQYVIKSANGPVQSRCQQNYLIVVTDGYPHLTNDAGSISASDSDYWYNPAFPIGNANANDWRSKAHIVTQKMLQGFSMNFTNPTATATVSVSTFVIGLSFPGDSATNLITDTSSMLYLMANNGAGNAYGVSDNTSLTNALGSTLGTIASRISSVSSVAVNTAFLTANTKLYRAKFNSGDWTGYLEAYSINPTTGDVTGYPNTPLWEAGNKLNNRAASRMIYTAGQVSGANYTRYDFSTSNASTLAGASFMNFSSASASNLVSYVRGDSTPTGYRVRSSKLGDMVYSTPVISGPPAGFYTDNNYSEFKSTKAGRTSLVLVGANDGMLHAFNADSGDEEWAYIPNILLPKLKQLRATPYTHTNYVDGTITVGDAFIFPKDASGNSLSSAAWRTVLVGGLREGGKGYYALDITDPANPIPLWEISASSSNGLGYSFGQPLILKLQDSSATLGFRWVAVLSNGYESTNSAISASLLVVDLGTGQLIKEIVVDATPNSGSYANGLSSPSAVDATGDGYPDYIYAGDLQGHLWKFDFTSSNSNNWGVSFKKGTTLVALFRAMDSSGNPQPITVAPDIVLRGGSEIVYFGTGKYFESGDQNLTQVESFYGVYDANSTANASNTQANNGGMFVRSDLQAQTVTQITSGSITYRVSSDNSPTAAGWYMDLPSSGERVVNDPVVKSGKIIFTTFIPNTDACSYGGTSWLMELALDSGGVTDKPVFDVNGDGNVSSTDTVTSGGTSTTPTGMYMGDGMSSTPTIIGAGAGLEYKYITNTTGMIKKVLEGGGTSQVGPRSWRQLL